LAGSVLLYPPPDGESIDDPQSAPVDCVQLQGAQCRRPIGITAVGDPDRDPVTLGVTPQPPRHADDVARKWLSVADGVVDQLGKDRDGGGEADCGDDRGEFTGEPVTSEPSPASVMRHHDAPAPLGDCRGHAHPLQPAGDWGGQSARMASARGSRTSATVPPDSRGRKDTHPFCRSTIRRTKCRPRPAPPCVRRSPRSACQYGSKASSTCSGAIPTPRSATWNATVCSSAKAESVTSPSEYFMALLSNSVTTVGMLERSPYAFG